LIFHFTASSYGIGIETISFIFVGGVIGKEKVLLGGGWQVLRRGRVEASLMTPINSFVDAAHTNEPSDQRSEDLKEPKASSQLKYTSRNIYSKEFILLRQIICKDHQTSPKRFYIS